MRFYAGYGFGAGYVFAAMGIAVPVTCAARSSVNHRARSATSCVGTHLLGSALGIALRFPGVSIVSGKIRLAVRPASRFSNATVRTRDTSAALNVT